MAEFGIRNGRFVAIPHDINYFIQCEYRQLSNLGSQISPGPHRGPRANEGVFLATTHQLNRACHPAARAVVHRELRRPGATLQLLWEEHRAVHPDGYGYSRYVEIYRAWAARLTPTMRQSHVASYSCRRVSI